MLASSYGWAKKDILEQVYLDELFVLARLITRRKINEYKMSLAITTNPQAKDPKRLWSTLDAQERHNEGLDYLDSEFDVAGFEVLKQTLKRNNSRVIIKEKGGDIL